MFDARLRTVHTFIARYFFCVVLLSTTAARFLMGMNMSKTRAPPSGANPSNLVDKRVDTEDDVLHVQVTFKTFNHFPL